MSRTRFGWCLLAVLVLVAGACGGDSGDDATASGADGSDASGASDGGGEVATGETFPVTVEHKFGETTVEARPERVVTVGLTDHDAVLALGVAPVGVTDWFGDHPYATWPWAQDALGDAEPEIVGDPATIAFEKIAELQPDVILALYAGLTQENYDLLSEIAPTVAQPDDLPDYGIPWDEQTLTIGRVLGQSGKAEDLVAGVEQKLADARAAHPEFAGKEGVVASPYNNLVSVFTPDDPRGRFLADLGFTQPSEIADLAGSQFSADLSDERLDLIDVDAIVWIVNAVETDVPEFDQDPIYSKLDVHTGRHEAFVENLSPLGGATSFVTVLSLPFLIDELVPQLATAVAGNGA